MCGRAALCGPIPHLRERFEAEPERFEFEPGYNAAPMQRMPVVRRRASGERVILGPGYDTARLAGQFEALQAQNAKRLEAMGTRGTGEA